MKTIIILLLFSLVFGSEKTENIKSNPVQLKGTQNFVKRKYLIQSSEELTDVAKTVFEFDVCFTDEGGVSMMIQVSDTEYKRCFELGKTECGIFKESDCTLKTINDKSGFVQYLSDELPEHDIIIQNYMDDTCSTKTCIQLEKIHFHSNEIKSIISFFISFFKVKLKN